MASTINSNTTDGVIITPDTSGEIALQSGGTTISTVKSTGIEMASSKTITLGDWTIKQSGTDLKFSYQGTDRFKLTSAGALTVEDDVTAFGSA